MFFLFIALVLDISQNHTNEVEKESFSTSLITQQYYLLAQKYGHVAKHDQ